MRNVFLFSFSFSIRLYYKVALGMFLPLGNRKEAYKIREASRVSIRKDAVSYG